MIRFISYLSALLLSIATSFTQVKTEEININKSSVELSLQISNIKENSIFLFGISDSDNVINKFEIYFRNQIVTNG